ncbi:hypothetical protein V8B97DRAFT_1920490 [Scleroderma yunnanense]
MTTNTTISMPTTNTPTEIVADATNAIKGQLKSIKTNKSKDHWEKEWYSILNEMCSPEDVTGHLSGEQAEAGVSSRQDKGKGWEVHPVSETQAKHLTHVPKPWGQPAGPSQGHGHSQSCCPCKIIKSTDHINSNDEVVDASAEGELQAEAFNMPANQQAYALWAKQAKSKLWARKQSIPPSPPTAASSLWLSNHGTSKSPGPLTEPLKIRFGNTCIACKGLPMECLRWDLEASNQWHEVHDCKVDALRDLIEHLWMHVFQPQESPSPHPIPALITFNSEDEPPTVNPPLRTSPTISPSLTRLFTLQGDPSSTLFDMSRGPSLPWSTPSVPCTLHALNQQYSQADHCWRKEKWIWICLSNVLLLDLL